MATNNTSDPPADCPEDPTPRAEDFVVVYVTAPSKDVAKQLAGTLVSSQLAACVNIIPGIESVYSWKGNIETDQEVLMMIKTRKSLVEDLTVVVNKEHPYDVAEVIAVPLVGGSDQYLRWLMQTTNK